MSEPPEPLDPGPPAPDAETVVVHRTWDDVDANLIVGLLRGAGIPSSLVSDVPHSVLPLTVDGLGEVRVVVARQHEEEARACIAARPGPGDDDDDAPPGDAAADE